MLSLRLSSTPFTSLRNRKGCNNLFLGLGGERDSQITAREGCALDYEVGGHSLATPLLLSLSLSVPYKYRSVMETPSHSSSFLRSGDERSDSELQPGHETDIGEYQEFLQLFSLAGWPQHFEILLLRGVAFFILEIFLSEAIL